MTKPIDDVRAMLAALIGGPDTPFTARRLQAAEFVAAFVCPPDIVIESGALGGVAVEWITPRTAPSTNIFVHLHGGGYVLGDPAGSRPFITDLARRLDCRVVSIDYRLAPENPFPAAVDDALAAYRALLLDHSPDALAVGGESAGGGLALALLLAAKEAGLPMPASVALVSPWVDLRCSAATFDSLAAADPLLTRRSLKEMGDAYLNGSDAANPFASPLFGNLEGLPPLLIHVGSEEVLLDDSRRLADLTSALGVPTTLAVWPEMIHVWHMFHPMLPEGAAAMGELAAFIQQHWNIK
ncbi:MAG TPA: alpha/beta hydrolase [Rhizomicrobium sp.]|jgi:acetyl esterase/lipase|nr:alpha/beta hydrolase [Rhizomicrobium sp.]